MEKVILNAIPRTVKGKQVGALRRAGQLPAVIYGHHFDPTPITLDLREASRILTGLSASSLVTLVLDGKEIPSLVRERQRDFIRGTFRHVDFQAVSLTEKIRTKVNIHLEGISPAVKDFNGVIVNNLGEIEVESLPQYLPEKIVLDLSKLIKIGDGIYVRDIVPPANVEILTDAEEMVVVVTGQQAEEVVEVAPVEEPEVIERGKKPEEPEEK